ncbi:hypothetical protein PTSG_06679 [Salpingoeca rosetta]|uniref:DUF4042 domain-containing protein n=1 Tax=Salpingoeca rosetta (strain ATCC 50818 / BSB-021) TaxID=946362 RepID=F2UFP3_SALR5|nr:uncharacterized protein PTSG_06679 [Salpingoeca rosetta]EGD75611.1 hypothetical protein PTSG_06679 [Salpingoeca rosetta]|eukprot:XP_004992068.1 hypothetical protein PTSG_06679 [Salpingoeca rosetta]
MHDGIIPSTRSGAGTARQERNQHQHHQHQQHRRRRRNRRDQPQHHQRQRGASDESELSDASPSAIARGKRVFAHQIRVQAIQCAQTIALLCPKKVLFRYWLSFFPESLEETAPSVYNVIARDLIPKGEPFTKHVRSCCLWCLIT